MLLEAQSSYIDIGGRQPFLDCGVTIDGTDISAEVEATTVSFSRSLYDLTTIGQAGRVWHPGPRDDAITINWWQTDVGYGWGQGPWGRGPWGGTTVVGIDEILAGLLGSSGFEVIVDTLQGPVYTGTCVVGDYVPLGGKAGDGLLATATLPVVGELAVSG